MPSQPQTQTRRSNRAAHPSLKVRENALSQAKRGVKKSRKSGKIQRPLVDDCFD